jgi:AraC family transcriptional regulator of adaptative response/methylated-DNA-[protein]-cysteine methyltransferase
VLDRDTAADGRFVYAVASTGIYCRPSCPSRRPRRAQVSFYPTPADAEAAGFRACRRCAPGGAETDARRRVRQAREYLERHPDDTVTLDRLARVVGLSPYHLQRSFKRTMGMSPKAYASRLRMERMKAGLREGETTAAIPLDVRGTAFQHRVWEALQRIPAGATRSYSENAREIGQPSAARAVAGACADNRVAVVIPCHRVVREDGGLGGYRWGVERKREILRRERGGPVSS